MVLPQTNRTNCAQCPPQGISGRALIPNVVYLRSRGTDGPLITMGTRMVQGIGNGLAKIELQSGASTYIENVDPRSHIGSRLDCQENLTS